MSDLHTDPEHLAKNEYSDSGQLDTRNQIQNEYNIRPRDWFQWVFDRLALDGPTRLLDLGSGPGDLWVQNLARLPDTLECWLADLSVGMVQAGRAALGEAQPRARLRFTACDSQALPFGAGAFDAVTAIGLYDHVPELDTALGEARRALRDGGRLYASAGGREHLKEFAELLEGLAEAPALGGAPEHFGLENGRQALEQHFRQVELHEYRDLLVFREAEPVLAYILSEKALRRALGGEKQAELARRVEKELEEKGSLQVTVQKGLFVAGGYPNHSLLS